jgi:hypothetical protein
MIPTPRRISANRRWSAVLAVVVAATISTVGFVVDLGLVPTAVALGLAFTSGLMLYRFGTRVMRRRQAVVRRGLDDRLAAILDSRVAYYRNLDPAAKERFRLLAAIFLDETPVTGAGCEVDDAARVLVAASAVIPILGFPDWEYSTLREVLVKPGEFVARRSESDDNFDPILGMVDHRGGSFHGTLILSKADLFRGFSRSRDKMHVGIHEFAHLVDEGDGAIDGVPAWLPRKCIRDWLDLVHHELGRDGDRRHADAIEDMDDDESDGDDRGQQGREVTTSAPGPQDSKPPAPAGRDNTPAGPDNRRPGPDHQNDDWDDMPAYAFTNEQEFFAVSTEYFFKAPRELAARHGQLYDMLRQTFRQDPAGPAASKG